MLWYFLVCVGNCGYVLAFLVCSGCSFFFFLVYIVGYYLVFCVTLCFHLCYLLVCVEGRIKSTGVLWGCKLVICGFVWGDEGG